MTDHLTAPHHRHCPSKATGSGTSLVFGQGHPPDVNNSGGVPTVQDLFDFLGAYFGAHNCG